MLLWFSFIIVFAVTSHAHLLFLLGVIYILLDIFTFHVYITLIERFTVTDKGPEY